MKSKKRKGARKALRFPAEAAMRRAARRAREIARRFGTPIYVLRDGKIVAESPGSLPNIRIAEDAPLLRMSIADLKELENEEEAARVAHRRR